MNLPKTIHADDLAELVGIQPRQLRNIADEGFIPRPDRGEYKCAETLEGLFKYYRQRDGGKIAEVKLAREQEKLRSDKVQADLDEGKVSTKAELESAVTRWAMQLKSRQMVVPRSLSRELSLLKDPHEIEARLESVLRGTWESTDLRVAEAVCPECKAVIVPKNSGGRA